MTTPSSLNLTPEAIQKLEKLKKELTFLHATIENMAGKSPYEVEGRIRQYQDKEAEIKKFLNEIDIA